MWIKSLKMENLRSLANTEIEFSSTLNVLVGANNSGKTTILKSLLTLQQNTTLNVNDTRLDSTSCIINITTAGTCEKEPISTSFKDQVFKCNLIDNKRYFLNSHGNPSSVAGIFPNIEPNNFIYPFLSKRKVTSYQEEINKAYTTQVSGNFSNLYLKIDRISNPDFLPAYNDYIKACEEIIGFRVSAVASDRGKKGAYIVHNDLHIPIDFMGEGIANLLALIVDLCVAENKLFLIEEPENDIHPKALKGLLRLIEKKSKTNQKQIKNKSIYHYHSFKHCRKIYWLL